MIPNPLSVLAFAFGVIIEALAMICDWLRGAPVVESAWWSVEVQP